MKIPVSWLREHCPVDLSAEEIADILTRHGVEIDRILHPWASLSGVVVARVLEVTDHPDADKLSLATVDAGGEERRVVVGVRNMGPDDLVPYAPPGATLPGFEGGLERRTIRGQVSDGMLCSPKELGISADHSGILVLEEGEPGDDVAALLGLDDAVLDIDAGNFPNRPDFLSIHGVAREVAAATGEELREPDTSVREGDEKAADAAAVEVRDSERCPRYLARVIRGVTVGPSPVRAQIRLAACGMRPVSNVVDATNYALLELGHPTHAFDLETLAGSAAVVRRAADAERLTTLDGVERRLIGEDLVIADTDRAVAIAGVMGGGETEVGEGTRDLVLESAYFEPVGVLRTARRLGLRTEASVRFERGADPEAVGPAAARAARLIAEWAGGTVLRGEDDVGEAPPRRRVSMRPARASIVLGMEVTAADAVEAFAQLRLAAEPTGDVVEVEVPGRRVDLEIEADLIEEVGRVGGYERLPATLPGVKQAGGLNGEQRVGRMLRDALVRAGLLEAMAVSFASETDLALFGDGRREGVRLANPISEEQAFLRSSLLPGLLRAAAVSAGQRRPSVRLFEVGHVFRAGDPDPVEEEAAAVLLHGPSSEGWPGEPRPLDLLDARGVLEHLLGALGVGEWSLEPPAGPPYHPGRSAAVVLGAERIGEVGEVHPHVARRFDLEGRVAALEVRTAPLLSAAATVVEYVPASRLPPVRRDVAFLLDRATPAGRVREAVTEAAGELLERAILFDVFEGEPLPAGKKSLAFALDFRAPDRTLTDEEANGLVGAVADRLAADFGAELRAG